MPNDSVLACQTLSQQSSVTCVVPNLSCGITVCLQIVKCMVVAIEKGRLVSSAMSSQRSRSPTLNFFVCYRLGLR